VGKITRKEELRLFRLLKKAWGCVGFADRVIFLPRPEHRGERTMAAVEQLRSIGWTVKE
jgi:hypothetical protein